MKCISFIVSETDSDNIVRVLPLVLPELTGLFALGGELRCNCMSILYCCINALSTISGVYKVWNTKLGLATEK